ncbi:GNAT family N-acetyltransferase [Nocardiopsis sp. NPDC050513]|uniref:GNAT family N-acetyltransferase n=1 Tax=Nocardiopsis sp. NPDC050513 TaxID=3364338 RepID=UPI00379544EF
MATEVTDAPDRRRYEIRVDGETAGFSEYVRTGDLVTFTHTEITPSHEGEGLGGTLVRAALDDVRSQGLSVLPLCPFVKVWIARHREYADLVYRAPTE